MSLSWVINAAIGALLLPPLNLILVCGLGLWMRRRWPRFGLGLSITALLVLIVISTRFGASLFVTPLEQSNSPLLSAKDVGAQAIVVLGGSRISRAPEYAGLDIPSSPTLQRLRYAAKLQREIGLPILATGGAPDGAAESEAAIMARVLRDDFSVPVKWIEGASNNTAENAQFSYRILNAAGVHRILLVTDALHMQRAKLVFEQMGLEVIPAPTIFVTAMRPTATDFLPNAHWLQKSSYAMHEWLGLAWYALRHRNLTN
ncbi:YdcF family protein [Herminiimonas fonticola]|uniref:Uncharacterized SAM-binding protein YcdF (DUF218 family) n=1 Tax=Herminiimonas fonticola TaxID=303380 RepID=A0A4R6GHG9_9BURK|nr:YdcF family protein [Herminiimonas fonticola]RBA24674.1 hypothetical protein Hfont_0307 [Herminiimonas fonticola]TDN93790.1 uncharacterized SAM-binding protein YcdF (DUF218 family) [Herminiimonas fonticola]